MPRTAPSILTKIVATIGPACRDLRTLTRLIEEGARIIRINFSHGTLDDFESSLAVARAAASVAEVPVGVLGDLSGPKIRTGQIANGELELNVGDHVELTPRDDFEGSRDRLSGVVTLPTNYEHLVTEVQVGHRLLINDGAIRMLVTNKVEDGDNPRLICRCTVGGPVSNRKGVNLPDTDISAPALTDWDRTCAKWAVEHGLDFLALSFVRRAADIEQLKEYLRTLGRDSRGLRSHTKLPIIAKIEKPQAIAELEAICEATDGIMVARGDLGVEMDLAQVPVIQKQIIEKAHDAGKPVIVATQMLQSMIEEATPTRAEVSDVANAIMDGADAVMLSGETAVGKHPVEAVMILQRTAEMTEAYAKSHPGVGAKPPRKPQESRYRTAAIAHGVSVIVRDLDARYVVMWSELGGGARYISQNRLAAPIIAISSNEVALRQMTLYYGVVPVLMSRPGDSELFIHQVDEWFAGNGWADPGDAVVVVKGEPIGIPGVTNEIRIHYVGDVCRVRWHVKA